ASRVVDAPQEPADAGLCRPSLAPGRLTGDGGRRLLDRLGLGAPGELITRHRRFIRAGPSLPPGPVATRRRAVRSGRPCLLAHASSRTTTGRRSAPSTFRVLP